MMKATNIILDTDIETDCDDAGAIGLLHSLANYNEANILAMVCNVSTPWGAPCIQAINTYFNRASIPVGTIKIKDYDANQKYDKYRNHLKSMDPKRRYNQHIAQNYENALQNAEHSPDAVDVYRKTLSEQIDNSVVICAVGLLSALSQLLYSQPDHYSILDGYELIKQKVRLLVTMGKGIFPQGCDNFNWAMDKDAAAHVLNHWPSAIAVSSFGDSILTGARLSEETSVNNPIRKAYELFFQQPGMNRPSWDQVATLYSVRGASDLFNENFGYTIQYNAENGSHTWTEEKKEHSHIYFSPAVPNDKLSAVIEDLMIYEPQVR